MKRGLYRTTEPNLVCRALAVLRERITVSYSCKEGWYEVITHEEMTDADALYYSQLAQTAACAGLKAQSLNRFAQEDL